MLLTKFFECLCMAANLVGGWINAAEAALIAGYDLQQAGVNVAFNRSSEQRQTLTMRQLRASRAFAARLGRSRGRWRRPRSAKRPKAAAAEVLRGS